VYIKRVGPGAARFSARAGDPSQRQLTEAFHPLAARCRGEYLRKRGQQRRCLVPARSRCAGAETGEKNRLFSSGQSACIVFSSTLQDCSSAQRRQSTWMLTNVIKVKHYGDHDERFRRQEVPAGPLGPVPAALRVHS